MSRLKTVLITCVVLLLIDVAWLCAPMVVERFKERKPPAKPAKPAKAAKSSLVKAPKGPKAADAVESDAADAADADDAAAAADADADRIVPRDKATTKTGKAAKTAKTAQASPVSAAVTQMMTELPALVQGFVAMPRQLHDKSVRAAAAVRDKLYQYANQVSHLGNDDTDPTMILLKHKDELEALRASHPEAFTALVRMSAKGPVLTTADTAELADLMD